MMAVKELEKNWSNNEDFGYGRNHLNGTRVSEGDVVVSPDAQERLNGGYVVSAIREEKNEAIHQRGVFWDKQDALKFANDLDVEVEDEPQTPITCTTQNSARGR